MAPCSALVSIAFFYIFSGMSAQTGNINFSGTWVYNEPKSPAAQGNFRMAPGKLVVTHNGINLTVERTSSGPNGEIVSNDKFTTDGNECVNTMIGDNTRKSTVKWSPDGNSLHFSHYMKFEMQGETVEFTSSETWKLNEVNNTMSVETVFSTPDGEVKSTNVYSKK
jgi:hypothetical protein